MAELEDGTLSFEARLELVSKDVQNVQQQLQQIGKVGESVGNKIDVSLNDAFGNLTKSLGGSTEAVVNKLNELVSVSQTSASAVQQQLQNIQDKLQQSFDARVPEKHFDTISTGARKAGDSIENELTPVIEKATKALKSMVAGFTVQQIITQIGKTRGEFQQLEVAFETMLGSEERSSKLMNELVNTAAHTPFDLKGIADGAKQLLAYGFAAEDVNDTLVMLGNVASGLSIPLNDIVYLYGTTMTQGRLFTQDLRQFMGRGIPLAEELSKQFGVTKDKVGDLVTEGKIGFNEVAKAMKAMTSEGGQFYNLMDKQSQTINGLVSNLQDAIDTMMNEIGKKTEGVFAEALKFGIQTVENYENVGKAIVELLAVLGPVKATMVVVNMLQQHHNKIMREAVALRAANTKANIQMSVSDTVAAATADLHAKAVKRLNIALTKTGLTNPYVLLAAAATAFGFAVYKVVTYQTQHEKILKEVQKASEQASGSAEAEIARLSELKGALSSCEEGTEDYKNIKQQIIDQFSQYDSTLTDENTSIETLTEKYEDLTTAIQKSFAVRAFNETYQKEQEKLAETYTGQLEEMKKKLISTFGEETGAKIHQGIVNAIRNGNAEAEIVWWGDKLTAKVKGVSDDINELIGGKLASATGHKLFGLSASDFTEFVNNLNSTSNAIKNLRKEALETFGLNEEDLTAEQKAAEEKRKKEEEEKKKKEEEEQQKKEAADRKKKQKKYQEEIKEAIIKGEYDIAQAQIDAMEDGADKQDAQLRLNYNKRLKEMERQEEEYKKANKELYGNADLTEDQKKVLQQMRTLADSELAIGFAQIKKGKDQKTQDELNKRLQMWKDFSEKQTAIVEEYAEKRRKIEESETMTKPQKKEQLDRLDQQQRNDTAILIAQMGITDENVAEELIGIITDAYELATDGAVETLQEQLLQVEQQLQEMLKGGITEKNEEQYRRLKAQQVSFTKAVSKAKNAQDQLNNSANSTGKNIKQRMDLAARSMATLNQAISDVRGEFGELFDETTNNALDMIQTTMDAGIGVLNTLQATGVATATALSTAEKASVILTVISAAVQLTMGLVKLLSSTSQSAKAKKMADEYAKAAEAYHKEWEKLRHEHRNSVGTQYYDELFADINSLRKEKKETEKEIRDRRRAMNLAATKKSKEKRTAEWEDAQAHLREVEQQIEDAERTFFENLLQSNSKDFAANMADQLVEGWESGMRDMTSIFDDAVNDMLRSVVKSQLRMKLEEVYKDAFDEMQKQFGDRAEFSQNDLDAIKDRVNAANEQAKALADYYRQWWDALELNTGDLSASVGAIQGMTQDTAEELNGRFTALQMSGASIDLKMDSVVAGIHSIIGANSGMADSIALAVGIANDQLNVLEDIRNHTARLASMERSLNTITNQMSTLTGQ